MAQIGTYLMLLFGITFALYLGGYTSGFLSLVGFVGGESDTTGQKINNIQLQLTAAIGAAIVVAITIGGSSLGRSSALLALFGTIFMDFAVLPLSFITETSLPFTIKLFVFAFMHLLIILSALDLMAERDI